MTAVNPHAPAAKDRNLNDDRAWSQPVRSYGPPLGEDMQAKPEDITPRLVASQVLALYATLFAEGERRRLAGQAPEEIHLALEASAMTGLDLLEHGIGTYGSQS